MIVESTASKGKEPPMCSDMQKMQKDLELAVHLNSDLNEVKPFERVNAALNRWKTITKDVQLLQVLQHGLQIPLQRMPPPRPCVQRGEVQTAVQELLRKGAVKLLSVEQASRTKCWIPVFTVPKRDSNDFRFITDLRVVNDSFRVPHFQQDTWATVREVLQDKQFKYGVKLDLKDMFHHIRMHPHSSRWMRFMVDDTAYEVVAMPFGLKSSPYWCHRLSKVVQLKLKEILTNNVRVVWYVDDILLVSTSVSECLKAVTQTISLLTELGLKVNFKKSVLTPSVQLEYLGQLIDLKERIVKPVEQRLEAMWQAVHKLRTRTKVTPQWVAKVAGILNDATKSNCALLGLSAGIMRWAGSHSHGSWSRAVHKNLTLHQLLLCAEQALIHPVPVVLPNLEVPFKLVTDSSDLGWGAVLTTPEGRLHRFNGFWRACELNSHITWKETTAAAFALKLCLHLLPNSATLLVRSDCVTTVRVLRKGSRLDHLNVDVRTILQEYAKRRIYVVAEFVPGINNNADALSRMGFSTSDYKLHPYWFNRVCQQLHVTPTIDAFAARHNTLLQTYWSWKPDPWAAGVNALAQNWPRSGVWANPPWRIIHLVLRKIVQEKARVVLLTPVWPNAVWWPLLRKLCLSQFVLPPADLYVHPIQGLMPAPRWLSVASLVDGQLHYED